MSLLMRCLGALSAASSCITYSTTYSTILEYSSTHRNTRILSFFMTLRLASCPEISARSKMRTSSSMKRKKFSKCTSLFLAQLAWAIICINSRLRDVALNLRINWVQTLSSAITTYVTTSRLNSCT